MMIKTEKLLIKPATMSEMRLLYENETDTELKQAYSEMLEAMSLLPGREYWATDWRIFLSDGTQIGGVGFKGVPDENGCIEIGYGIDEPYWGHGYATQAVEGMLRWAFSQPDVLCVQAQTLPGNDISQHILIKNGMKLVGEGEEGPLFEIRKAEYV